MAYADKIYCPTWENYCELVEWAANKVATFDYGKKKFTFKISDYIMEYSEDDFVRDGVVMYRSNWLDCYLANNCPVEWLKPKVEYMKGETPFNIPEGYKQNRSVKVSRTKRSRWPLDTQQLFVQSKEILFGYNDELGIWSHYNQNMPRNTNTMHVRTLRSAIKKIKKSFLPAGVTFLISGRYQQQEFLIRTK